MAWLAAILCQIWVENATNSFMKNSHVTTFSDICHPNKGTEHRIFDGPYRYFPKNAKKLEIMIKMLLTEMNLRNQIRVGWPFWFSSNMCLTNDDVLSHKEIYLDNPGQPGQWTSLPWCAPSNIGEARLTVENSVKTTDWPTRHWKLESRTDQFCNCYKTGMPYGFS